MNGRQGESLPLDDRKDSSVDEDPYLHPRKNDNNSQLTRTRILDRKGRGQRRHQKGPDRGQGLRTDRHSATTPREENGEEDWSDILQETGTSLLLALE